jgi:hypothetical protein
VTTVREYDAADGHLVRVFRPKDLAEFRRPRGLRFGRRRGVPQPSTVGHITRRQVLPNDRTPRLTGAAPAPGHKPAASPLPGTATIGVVFTERCRRDVLKLCLLNGSAKFQDKAKLGAADVHN